jgi:hypothetical protein
LPLINSEIQAQVHDALTDLVEPVKFNVFTQRAGGALECSYCAGQGSGRVRDQPGRVPPQETRLPLRRPRRLHRACGMPK